MTELQQGSGLGPYPYRILRRLGHKQGNMAEVYLAAVGDNLEESQANLVVVKITRLDEKHGEFFKATLENEVERLRRLKHPGIVRLYPIQKTGLRNLPYMAQANLPGRPWFSVMEYLAGDSLANLLQGQRQLDIGPALEIGRSLAATLDYIHNLNQVHLDVKPENILFRRPLRAGEEPQPVLIDFGIARSLGQAGLEAGTLQWSAPERVRFVRGDKPPELMVRPHPSMDVYAVGMVLYVMIAGRLPFAERTRKGLTTAILEGNPTAPSQYHRLVQKELDDLILMALATEPADRPTADELARALEELAIRLGYRPHYGYLGAVPAALPPPASKGATAGGSKARFAAVALGGIVLLQGAALAVTLGPDVMAALNGGPPAAVVQTSPTPNPAASAIAAQPSATPSPTSSAPTATATPAAAQPAPTDPSTATPTRATVTAVPTRTPVPQPTATPTARANNAPAQPSPPQAPAAAAPALALAGPSNGARLRGTQTFSWTSSVALEPNQALEVVIYRQGQDPLSGAGLADPTSGASVRVDLDAIDRSPNHPLDPGPWLWAVNLVQRNPYQALRTLASGWQFTYAP